MKQIAKNDQTSATSILGYVHKVDNDSCIFINDEPQMHSNLQAKQRMFEHCSMQLYVLNNIRNYINLHAAYDQFSVPLPFTNSATNGSIKAFSGIKYLANPKSQKNVLYRKANAVDRDQGQMEMFIKQQADVKKLIDS